MKKIFTLIFSLGLLTSAFAQSGNRHQRQNQDNTYQQSVQYSRNQPNDRYNNGSNVSPGGRDRQWNNNDNKDHHDHYAYNSIDRRGNYGSGDDRFYPVYTNDRRGNDYDENYQAVRVPLFQIILGIGHR